MCGIVGIYHFGKTEPVSADVLAGMRDTMQHRGPDGADLWVSPDYKIGLGHRRLSIIDLSEIANQPMSNEDDTLWIVFNGEIYNHAEIRAELERRGGHRWKTDHSDTEVILHAFEEWGIDCLARFRGMFAFALWDGRNRELWLVRDRVGVKPLYYTIENGHITFASEIKALLKYPGQRRDVHEQALFYYLSILTTPAPQTLFDGIQKLSPGTWLRIQEDGQVKEYRYWDVWEHAKPLATADENEIAEQLLAELRTAVKLRKVSDVPVGVFLSGGIDSSTNTALFSEGEGQPVKTFSIGYEGEYQSYQNELHYARQMAAQVDAQHHERLLNLDDLIDFLPRMVFLQDEPIADPVCVPVYYVSKLARDNGVTVCQVGEGADELFWGYPNWKRMLQIQNYADLPVPNIFKQALMWGLKWKQRESSYSYEWLRRDVAGNKVFWGGAEAFFETPKQNILSPRLRKKFAEHSYWNALAPVYQDFVNHAWEPSNFHWMTYVDLKIRLPELLLMRVDKMSMGVGLESRVPFLDHKFVELALSIPASMKTRNGVLKYLLKKAVRGLIPDELIDRKKQGFGVPVHEWFYGRLGDEMHREVKAFCKATDYFDWQNIEPIFKRGDGVQIWYLFNLALWWKSYIDGSPV